jgi:hypothetical protein
MLGPFRNAGTIAVLLLLSGCGDEDAITLYRNSILDPGMRVHVGSFDSGQGADYNAKNCKVAAELFGAQEGVQTRFWCEKGRFRK